MDTSIVSDLIQGFIAALIMIVPLWKIHEKAGFNPGLSLIVFLPGFGLLISPLILAFAPWPTLKKIKGNKEG